MRKSLTLVHVVLLPASSVSLLVVHVVLLNGFVLRYGQASVTTVTFDLQGKIRSSCSLLHIGGRLLLLVAHATQSRLPALAPIRGPRLSASVAKAVVRHLVGRSRCSFLREKLLGRA